MDDQPGGGPCRLLYSLSVYIQDKFDVKILVFRRDLMFRAFADGGSPDLDPRERIWLSRDIRIFFMFVLNYESLVA